MEDASSYGSSGLVTWCPRRLSDSLHGHFLAQKARGTTSIQQEKRALLTLGVEILSCPMQERTVASRGSHIYS